MFFKYFNAKRSWWENPSSTKLCPRRAGYANGRNAEVRREKLVGDFFFRQTSEKKCEERKTEFNYLIS
jgi:hypothetical protein